MRFYDETKSSTLLQGRSVCPIGTRAPVASKLSTSKTLMNTLWRFSNSLRGKAIPGGSTRATGCFWESTTPPSWSPIRMQPQVLSRSARVANRRSERKLWHRAGTSQQCFRARLRITALRAPSGPGIELLEYLSPRNGRAIPVDEHANDLVHRQTQLETENPDAATEPLRMAKTNFYLRWTGSFAGPNLGFARGFVVRDPDGHAISIVQH